VADPGMPGLLSCPGLGTQAQLHMGNPVQHSQVPFDQHGWGEQSAAEMHSMPAAGAT
jgi:hypothetical protein